MQTIKHVINLLIGKLPQSILPTEALSSTEMDLLFGGKPDEVIAEQAYWWIEDEQLAPDVKLD